MVPARGKWEVEIGKSLEALVSQPSLPGDVPGHRETLSKIKGGRHWWSDSGIALIFNPHAYISCTLVCTHVHPYIHIQEHTHTHT